MMDEMSTQPLDVQRLILEQLQQIGQEVRLIPQILARLDALAAEQQRLSARDDAQQKQIDGLTMRANELSTSISIISNEVRDAQRNLDGLIKEHKVVSKSAQKACDITESIKEYMDEMDSWRPWLQAIKWFVLIVGGVFATALAAGLLGLL